MNHSPSIPSFSPIPSFFLLSKNNFSALTQLQVEVKLSLPEWEVGMGTSDSAGEKAASFPIAECHFRSYQKAVARQPVGRNQGPVFLAGCQLHTESKSRLD